MPLDASEALSSARLSRADDLAPTIVTILVVDGMGCDGCAARVRGALLEPLDVVEVEIELRRGLATVYSRGPVDSRRFEDAVRRAGERSGQRYEVRRLATITPLHSIGRGRGEAAENA
jgi:copper chaperone CopZ